MLTLFVKDFSDISQMNFERSIEQNDFISKVDACCQKIREPEEKAYLEEKFNERLIPEFSKIGMLGCPISARYGGLGYDILTYVMALERIGEEGSSIRTFFSAHTSIGQMVLQSWANEEQNERYLPHTATGQSIMGFALTEPDAGSDPSTLTSYYEDMGNHYLLSGKKHWIGNGTIADIVTTYARDNVTGKISAFIVDMNSPGIETSEMKNKMGLLTVKNAEIYFHKCKVPKENMLSLPGQGLNIAYSALIDGRLSVAAGSIGVMSDCLTETVRHSKSRKQHGSPLGKKQLIQDHIAKIAVAIESSKWLTYRAAQARQRLHNYVEKIKHDNSDWQSKLNRANTDYSVLRGQADRLAAIAKFHASNAAFDTANSSVQIFGSYGYQKSSRVARHFLDSRATIIYEGANEVLKLKIAADILGRDFKSY
jgi:alkylation response protein AidB-like acyl-CoA dehydrogenase